MDALRTYLRSPEYLAVEGWCTPEKALKLVDLVEMHKPKTCVELGVHGGRSLLPISAAAGKDATVIGVDAWAASASTEGTNDKANDDWWKTIDYDYFFKYTRNLLDKHGCFHVQLWRDKSANVFHKFEDQSIDLLHQDSNQSEEVSCAEVGLYWNKVRPGGIWVFDDTNWPTTQKAQVLLETKGYSSIYDSGSWKVYQRAHMSQSASF
jgi:predicted O-methyltransferase YrrM